MRGAQDIDAQSLPGITYATRSDSTPKGELSALVNVYRFVLGKADRNAPGVSDTSITILKNTEEVEDVDQRPG